MLLRGRARIENPRWTAFRSHYRFEAFYCQPGIEGAHEKGGVEGEVGYFRRNYLVPVPEVDSLAELNARIAAAEQAEDGRRIGTRIRTIGQDFAAEAPLLIPLPDEPFETGLLLTPRVDRYSQVTVRDEPVLGAGPADRPPGAGRAALLGAGHLRPGAPRPPGTSG